MGILTLLLSGCTPSDRELSRWAWKDCGSHQRGVLGDGFTLRRTDAFQLRDGVILVHGEPRARVISRENRWYARDMVIHVQSLQDGSVSRYCGK